MIKDMLTDILKDLLKALVGFIVPVSLVLVGAVLIGLSLKFENTILLITGGIVALVGLLWGAFLVLWHSGG